MKKLVRAWVCIVLTMGLLAVAAGCTSSAARTSGQSGGQGQDSPRNQPVATNPVLVTFTVVGDSRIDAKTPNMSRQDYLWLNNSRVISRLQEEMEQENSRLLLFNGDMIMGFTGDNNELNRQYAFWRGLVAGFYNKGIYVVPVAGNHEVQDTKTGADGKTVKFATKANEEAWRTNMGDLIFDEDRWRQIFGTAVKWDPNNFPKVGTDHITTDQSKLDYSFDYRGSHFAIINTDPAGYDSHAPVEWLKQDLANARAQGAQHLFVIGHKPAYTYKYNAGVKLNGLDVDPAGGEALWQVIEANKATYFSAHEHVFNISRPKGGAYQIIAGTGGAPFEITEPTGNPVDRMYAWVTVNVYTNGKVHIDGYGFDERFGKTQKIQGFDLESGF